MLRRIAALYARYAAAHLGLSGPGCQLLDKDGRMIGNVDMIKLTSGRLHVSGWTLAGRVWLRLGEIEVSAQPGLIREDVAQVMGCRNDVGFFMTLAGGSGLIAATLQGPPTLTVSGGAAGADPVTRILYLPKMGRTRLGLKLRFAGALLRAAPGIAGWFVTGDPKYRARVKRAFDLQAIALAGPMTARIFETPDIDTSAETDKSLPACPITIIMPVYNAFDLLAEVLDRIETHTDLPWRLILIEDCSTDARVRPFLRDWVAGPGRADRVKLIENVSNKGFIGSVNDGLKQALTQGDHVVLLNSDALVPSGWASRLLRPIRLARDVASVTPMSNDAEIFSVPMICKASALAPGQGDAIDAVARLLHPEAVLPEVPTGVGFCMAMNIDFLRRLPELDTIFGRGYGEEVDWCQKARALDGRHIGLGNLFVEHRGGTSFGSADKAALIARNNNIVARRYTGYDREVQDFIAADPLVTARMALAMAWAGSVQAEQHADDGGDHRVPVYLAHSLGGGADKYLDRRISDDLTDGRGPAVILRVGGPERWQVEIAGPDGRLTGSTGDFEFVRQLLAPLKRRRIVYSCGVGDPDPVTLPGHLLTLANDADSRIEVLFHDFFPLSPSYTLLDSKGRYRGPLGQAGTTDDPAHNRLRADGSRISLADWQQAWGALIAAADQIVVFSEDSRKQVLSVYPDAARGLQIRPHRMLSHVPPIPRPRTARRVIGVLGDIGPQKGAYVLRDLASLLSGRSDLGLALIGNLDPACTLPPQVPVHGNYDIAEIPELVERYGITDWLIPSVWPETFSYTTHETLATGLPVHAFAIGAQGDAVAKAANGHAIAFKADGNLAEYVLNSLLDTHAAAGQAAHHSITGSGKSAT